MQKAIVSGAAKGFGQNMLQDKPQEVLAFSAAVTGMAGTGFDICESDFAILIGDDIVFTDDASVQVARQVFQSGQSFSGASAVDHPFSGH